MVRFKEAIYYYLQQQGENRSREWVFEQLEVSPSKHHPNLGPFYVFNGSLGEFWVSSRAKVVNFSAPARMSAKEAQDYVLDFLKRHIDDFENRNYVQEDTEFTDPLWKETWNEEQRESEVSIFENWATVQVNLETRRVHYASLSDLRHIRTTPPKLDEESARRLIIARNTSAIIEELDLVEHTNDGGQSWITIWNAVLVPGGDPSSPRRLYSIDADTGQKVK